MAIIVTPQKRLSFRRWTTGYPVTVCAMSSLNLNPLPSGVSTNGKGDFSGISILAGNAFTIALALIQGWDLGPLLFIYWSQSVIIGLFHIVRMLKLRQFCTEGFTSNGQRVSEDENGKRSTALFFAMHYGFFHLVYAFFLIGGMAGDEEEPLSEAMKSTQSTGDGQSEVLWLLLGILGFLVSHAVSFFRNVREDLKRRPNLGIMMFLPYVRIIPMHLTIILGGAMNAGAGSLLLVAFLLLKTGADYLFHIIEHRVLQKKTGGAEVG